MKSVLFVIALALVSPGIADLYRCIENRRQKDMAERKERAVPGAEEKAQVAVEIGTILSMHHSQRDAEAACEEARSNLVWTFMPQIGRWVQHDRRVSAMQSIGGG